MGLKLGSTSFFWNQNNCGLSGAYVTCIYCSLSVAINNRKMLHSMRRWDAFVFAYMVWLAKTRRPPLWAPWLRCHCTGRYTRSGIPLVYLWLHLFLDKLPMLKWPIHFGILCCGFFPAGKLCRLLHTAVKKDVLMVALVFVSILWMWRQYTCFINYILFYAVIILRRMQCAFRNAASLSMLMA